MSIRILCILFLFLVPACGTKTEDRFFKQEHARWQEARIERLKSKTGWLNLAGLYWLKKGRNTFGADSSNNIIFPAKAPPHIGSYFLRDGKIRFIPQEGVPVKHGDSLATEMDITTDRSGQATLLEYGSLAWFIIERDSLFGIRLRDYEHPAIREFNGIKSFPAGREWIIPAEFRAFDEPRELLIPTVIGTLEKNTCPGILRFGINGSRQELYPSGTEEGLFIVFADETNGIETYGGGRFIYIEKEVRDGKVMIDFNRAYNPPCAFTPFATCPLPPRQNFLSVRIEAGEKFAGH